MGNSGRLIYASPDRRTQSSPKQLSWRRRVMLLWRIKGMVIPWDVPMTQGEREKLTQAKNLIEEVVKDFTKNSVTLGFKAVDRCYFCGKPAVTIDKNGHYVCEKCNSIYTGDVE